MSTEERKNFARLSMAIIDVGTNVLRALLDREISPDNLEFEIQKFNSLPSKILNDSRIKNVRKYGYEQFDISLLYALLRGVGKDLNPPTNRWNSLPGTENVTVGDDIERIRHMRNQALGHATAAKTTDQNFMEYWQVLEEVMQRMDKRLDGSYYKQLVDISFMCMDDRYILELGKRYSFEKEVTEIKQQIFNLDQKDDRQQQVLEVVSDLKKKIATIPVGQLEVSEGLRQSDPKHGNTLALLTQHGKDDTFVSTRSVEYGLKILQKHRKLIYTGDPNMGKTKNALEVMKRVHTCSSDTDCTLYKLDNVKKWEDNITPEENMLVLIEDIDAAIKKDGGKYWMQIDASISEGKVRVIMTVLKKTLDNYWHSIEKFQLFNKDHIVDLSSEACELTAEEKRQIFENHCKKNNIKFCTNVDEENYRSNEILNEKMTVRLHTKTVDSVLNIEPLQGFSYTCFLFCKFRKYTKQGPKYFSSPSSVLMTTLNNMRQCQPLHYSVMCYMLLKKGTIEMKCIDRDTLPEVGLNRETSISDIEKAVFDIKDCHNYTVQMPTPHTYKFRHKNISDGIAISFGRHNSKLVVENCDKSFISEFVQTQGTESENDILLKLDCQDYVHLSRRLITNEKAECNSWWWWMKHSVLDDNDFVTCLTNTIINNTRYKKMIQKYVESTPSMFYGACCYGKTRLVASLYKNFNVETVDFCDCLLMACRGNYSDTALWLLNHKLGLKEIIPSLKEAKRKTLTSMVSHTFVKLTDILGAVDSVSKNLDSEGCIALVERWPKLEQEQIQTLLRAICSCGNTEAMHVIIRHESVKTSHFDSIFSEICNYSDIKVTETLIYRWPEIEVGLVYKFFRSRLEAGDDQSVQFILQKRRDIDLTYIIQSLDITCRNCSPETVASILSTFCNFDEKQLEQLTSVLQEVGLKGTSNLISLLRSDKESVKSILHELISGKVSARRIRLVLIGPRNAGKKSLINGLTKNQKLQEAGDHDILEHKCFLKNVDKKWIRIEENWFIDECEDHLELSVLDLVDNSPVFSAYRIFFTTSSLYMVTADMNELEKQIECCPEMLDIRGERNLTYKDLLSFILNTIFMYGGRAPVMIETLNATGVQGKEDIKKLQDDIAFHNQHLCSSIESIKCREMNTDEFRESVFEIEKKKIHLGDKIPIKWALLEQMLRKSTERILSFEQILLMNSNFKVPMQCTDVVKFLIFLHRSGRIVFFDEVNLRDYIILNPRWLLEAFECIISGKDYCYGNMHLLPKWLAATKSALFPDDLIEDLWKKDKSMHFSDYKHSLLVFLNRLNIIASPDHQSKHHLLPYFLNKQVEEVIFDRWKSNQNCTPIFCVKIKKEILPVPIFHNLIASCMKEWQFSSDGNGDIRLYYGCAMFDIKIDHTLVVSLVGQYLQFQIWTFQVLPQVISKDIRELVLVKLKQILHKFSNTEDIENSLYIKCLKEGLKSNLGFIDMDNVKKHIDGGCKKIQCSKIPQQTHSLEITELLRFWFSNEVENSSTQPLLTQAKDGTDSITGNQDKTKENAKEVECSMVSNLMGLVDKSFPLEWKNLLTYLDGPLSKVEIKSVSDVKDIFDKYEGKGLTALGEYSKLINVIEKVNVPAASMMKDQQEKIKAILGEMS